MNSPKSGPTGKLGWIHPLTRLSRFEGSELRVAAIFLALILLPGGILGYFSWQAFENQRKLAQERLHESYRQFARLAARAIDDELERAEEIWTEPLDRLLDESEPKPDAEALRRLIANEPLIAECFVLSGLGEVLYPKSVSLGEETDSSLASQSRSYIEEYEIFQSSVDRGEKLEYHEYELDQALAVYSSILQKVRNPQLSAMAQSYIGRVLMKQGEWQKALETFRDLLATYPEVRDVNKMYLRFLAQYQMSVCLENLGRDQAAVETLLTLNRDLLERSDTINRLQYTFFLDQIRNLARRLLSSPDLPGASQYQKEFDAYADRSKKRISEKYLLELLDRQLNKMVINRKHHRRKFRYVSEETEGEPFLLAYRSLPDAQDIYTAGLIGVQIDLHELSERLLPRILVRLKFNEDVGLAVINQPGEHVFGSLKSGSPIARETLAIPFEFWQVAVHLQNPPTGPGFEFRTVLQIWLIAILLVSIFLGAYIFIRRARQEAYLSKLKSNFVSSASHELRTPLASINMLAEILQMQLERTDPAPDFQQKANEYLEVIRRECDRLNRLIANVLDFSRMERGAKQYEFEYDEPGTVLRKAVEIFRPHAEAHDFALKLEVAEELPEVRMDSDAICQAILNLLANALKYSDDSQEIVVRLFREQEHVAIAVRDFGIGIPDDQLDRIFEEFYRIDVRLNSDRQGGMGLGLTVVKHIVDAHAGELRVQSRPGEGSTFTILLPIASAGKRKGKPAHERSAPVAAPSN